jgi:peptidoglycan/LPS O-acetylase OafA/YrhL
MKQPSVQGFVDQNGYRPDIDGLRAVAVLMVLAFHADSLVPGGYVGVDVFFVLSGYLITRIVLKELDSGRFTLKDFWLRRICRIAPASSCMLFAVLVTGFFLLLRDDYVALADSTIAHQFMGANVYFWRKTGYFDGPAELRPLLHTWSLAVEEQFYLVYPLLLLGMQRLRQSQRLIVLCGLAGASFVFSEISLAWSASAAFYLLPSRAWELLLGGIVCLLPAPRVAAADRRMEAVGCAGLVAIIWCAAAYSSKTRFPGAGAFVPCAATAALLYVHSFSKTAVYGLLATWPAVAMGQLSYSLYLWHWPVLVFANYLAVQKRLHPWAWWGAYSLITMTLACLSWRYVERPLRRAYVSNSPSVVSRVFLGGVALIALAAAGIRLLDGIPMRLPPVVRDVRLNSFNCNVSPLECDRGQLPSWPSRTSEQLRVVVWGDSHAMSVMAGVVAACDTRPVTLFQATRSSTPPLVGFDCRPLHHGQAPPDFGEAVLRFCRRERIDLVIMAASWAKYSRVPAFEASLERTLHEIASLHARAVVVADYPTGQELSPQSVLAAYLFSEDIKAIGITLAQHEDKNRGVAQVLARHASEDVCIRDPISAFVNSDGICGAVLEGKALYVDGSHLCPNGGLMMTGFFGAILDECLDARR